MTTPFMQTGLSFLLRKDMAHEEHPLGFLSPFSMEMWIGVLVAFLLTGLCVFLVARWASASVKQSAENGCSSHSTF